MLTDLYRHFVTAGDLCFDIGAHVGLHTRAMLALGAKVVAVEPQAECLDQLADTDALRLCGAVGDHSGTVTLHLNQDSQIASCSSEWLQAVKQSHRFGERQWVETRRVPLCTLRSLIHFYGLPKFIKVDVEGSEWPVLQTLDEPVSALSFEFTPEYIQGAKNCIAWLHTLGPYEFCFSPGTSMTIGPWVSNFELIRQLSALSCPAWGDIYARLK